MVISIVRNRDVGLVLLHALEHHGYTGRVLLSAHREEDAEERRARGAHHVLRPYEAASEQAVAALGR